MIPAPDNAKTALRRWLWDKASVCRRLVSSVVTVAYGWRTLPEMSGAEIESAVLLGGNTVLG